MMDWKFWTFFVLIVFVVSGSLIYLVLTQGVGSSKRGISEQGTPDLITLDNFPIYLKKQKIVQNLPSDSVVSLRLYNFDSGEREWARNYIVEKDVVSRGYGR